jgi:hypothetical protein
VPLPGGFSRHGRTLAGLALGVFAFAMWAQPSGAATTPSVRPSSTTIATTAGRLWRASSPDALRAHTEARLRGPSPADDGATVPTNMGPAPARWVHGHHPEVTDAPTTYGAESTNWSGEIATGAVFTGASVQWTVPAVQPSAGDEYSASWVGVDGGVVQGDQSLIQAGTSQDSGGGTTSYFAWYEVLPAAAIEIAHPVAAGDQMDVTVSEVVSGTWNIEVEDLSASWSFSTDVAYSGPGSSAEWIEEAPTVNGTQATLANFGNVQFSDVSISTANSSEAGVTPVAMASPSGVVIAYPGAFDTSDPSAASFPVTYGTPTPVVDSLSAGQGGTAGGTSVVIDGDYLTGASSVSFGGTSVAFTTNPDDTLTATSPAEPAGVVDVTVTTPGGTSARSGADEFVYVPSSSPPPSPPASGYDLVGKDGGVFVFPTGQSGGFYGSLPGLRVSVRDIVGMVPSSDDKGYFLVGKDGGVFAFGDAPFLGSLPGLKVSVNDIEGIVPTSDNRGYFLVGKDGGIFAFGDAPYLGSLPGMGIHIDNVIGIAATPSDSGYWVVAANGTVYAFGSAPRLGSATGTSSPVSGIASTPDGNGYWIVTQNGSVYPFGDAGNYGSLPGLGVKPARPVIGLVPTSGDQGYWLIGGDGGIFAFGDAPFVGALPSLGIHVTDIVGAVPTKP